jgi:hypothetical protein
MGKIRAKKAIKKMVENGGNVSKALTAVGYKPAYAKNPQKFLKTKTAQELMDEYLPDELIAERHNELANAGEIGHYVFPKIEGQKVKKGKKEAHPELTNDEIREIVESVPGCRLTYVKRDWLGAHAFFVQPDNRSRKDAIDMAYKLKGKYAPEQISITRRKYQDLTNEELMARKKAAIDFLKKRK